MVCPGNQTVLLLGMAIGFIVSAGGMLIVLYYIVNVEINHKVPKKVKKK